MQATTFPLEKSPKQQIAEQLDCHYASDKIPIAEEDNLHIKRQTSNQLGTEKTPRETFYFFSCQINLFEKKKN